MMKRAHLWIILALLLALAPPATAGGNLFNTFKFWWDKPPYKSDSLQLAINTQFANTFFAGNASGGAATPTFRAIVAADLAGAGTIFGPSGSRHSAGAVPDPGSSAGTTRFLREDSTWAVPAGGGGGVTSVGLSLPAIITVSGSPVTTTGTLTGALATQSANTLWAGPTSGGAAAPTFRAMVAADVPSAIIANSNLANMAATTLKGNAATSSAAPTDINVLMPFFEWPPGAKEVFNYGGAYTSAACVTLAQKVVLDPVYVPGMLTFTKIMCGVTSIVDTCSYDFGVYSSSVPGTGGGTFTRIAHTGRHSFTSADNNVPVTLTIQEGTATIGPGTYWVAVTISRTSGSNAIIADVNSYVLTNRYLKTSGATSGNLNSTITSATASQTADGPWEVLLP